MAATKMTIKEIQAQLGYKIEIVDEKENLLGDVPIGKVARLSDKSDKFDVIILDRTDTTTSVVLKIPYKRGIFDTQSSDYSKSYVRRELNSNFYQKLRIAVGCGKLVKHAVDLTADDGRNKFGSCEDFVSLMTTPMVRKYVDILDKISLPANFMCWTATAKSPKSYSNGNKYVCTVNGGISNNGCWHEYWYRPFFVLKNDTTVY